MDAAISKDGKNLFFVGDVKQSIYGFRKADPEIFLEKYKAFDSYEVAKEGEPRKILLSDNFRSIAPILSAANDVFYLTMTERVGGLRYGKAEALRANNKETLEDAAVELHCIDTKDVPSQPRVSREEIEADKADVRRSRVRNKDLATFDIHDRVNYSVKKSSLKINEDKTIVKLKLTVDTKYGSVMEYFEIFMQRMLLCRKAAEKLGLQFKLIINEQQLI